MRRFDTRRLEGFWIADQLEAPEEFRTANIADQRKLQCECAKAGSQDVARFQRATLQVFVCDHVEHGQSHGARNRVAAKRAEEFHAVVERVGNRASGHDGSGRSVLAYRLESEDDLLWAIYRPDVGERLGLADPTAALDAVLADWGLGD